MNKKLFLVSCFAFAMFSAEAATVKLSQNGVTFQNDLPSLTGSEGEILNISVPDSVEFYNGQYEYFKGWSDGVRENNRQYTITGKNDELKAIYSLPGTLYYTIYDEHDDKVLLRDTMDYSEMFYYETCTIEAYAGTYTIPGYKYVEGSERVVEIPMEEIGYPIHEYRVATFEKEVLQTEEFIFIKYMCDGKVLLTDSISRKVFENGESVKVLPLDDYKMISFGLANKGREIILNYVYEPGFVSTMPSFISFDDYNSASVENVVSNEADNLVSVYTLKGVMIRKNVKFSEATKGLGKGFYVVGNKLVRVMQ